MVTVRGDTAHVPVLHGATRDEHVTFQAGVENRPVGREHVGPDPEDGA